jgi:hypothetical protein
MIASGIQVLPEVSPQLTTYLGVPTRADSAYTDGKGKEDKGIRKRTEKALESIQEILRKVLEPNEAVFYCARAQAKPSAFEQLFLGWAGTYTGFGLFVLTNRRLLCLRVRRNGGWEKSLRTARWGDLEQAKVTGIFGVNLKIRYRSGSSETYWRIRGDDGKKIKQLIALFQGAGSGDASPTQEMTSICPNCLKPLATGVYECSQCHLRFKDEENLIRRALLIPGGGYFYVGQTGLGALGLIGEIVWIFLILIFIADAAIGEDRMASAMTAAVFAVILFFHKFLAIRHCRRFVREYIPLSS